MNTLTQYEPQQLTQSLTAAGLQSLLPDWAADLQQRVNAQEISPDTANGYQRGATRFFSWLADQQPSANVIRSWKADLLEAGKRPASVNAWLAGVRSFFSWLNVIETGRFVIPFWKIRRCHTRKNASGNCA